MSKENFRKLAAEWFKKANEDLGVAQLLYDEKAYEAAICYHCHQAAEKYLKGFLIYCGKDIEEEYKIHNLIKLFDYCKGEDKTISQKLEESCHFLNKYYIAARYPGDIEQYSWEEVKEALCAANNIEKEILDKIES